METKVYISERIVLQDGYNLYDASPERTAIELWKSTPRGEYLSNFEAVLIEKLIDAEKYQTILIVKFALSPRDVTFFNLKFGK